MITRAQLSRWNIGPLSDVEPTMDKLVERIDKDADAMNRTIDALNWSGNARRSADHRSDRENQQMRKVASNLDAVGAAASNGFRTMDPMVTSLRTGAHALEGDQFTVADDWTVQDNRSYTGDTDPDRTRRRDEAATETTRLQRIARELSDADAACGRAIAAANNEIVAVAPVNAGLNSSSADSDVEKFKNGTAGPDEIARLKAATELTPEQRAELDAGRPVTMSQGQFDYLQKTMRALDGMSVQDIEKLAPQLDSPASKGTLVNGMQLLSNPQVQTAGLDGAVEKGGMAQLPTQVRTLLTENPVGLQTHGPTPLDLGPDIPRGKDFHALNAMLGAGDPSLARGTDLDRGVLKQAAEISGAIARDPGLVTYGDDEIGWDSEKSTRQLVDDLLTKAGGDHTAVHDFVTGKNMDVTVSHGGSYNPTSHVVDLLRSPWESNQHGAEKVFEWIGGPEASSPNAAIQARAGETADGLARILANEHSVLAPAGTESKSVGEINPALTQTLSTTLAPYLPNFAGVTDPTAGVLTNHNATAFRTVDDLSHLFKTLDTDPKSAQIINAAGSQWVNHLAYQNGLNPDGPALGNNAGLLSQAMHEGLTDRLTDLREAQRWNNIVEYNRQAVAFDVGSALAGKVPGIGDFVGPAAPIVKAFTLDIPNNPADLANDNSWTKALEPLQVLTRPDSTTVNYYFVDGYAQSHPEVRNQFLARDGSSLFAPDGHLNWDAVNSNEGEFRREIHRLPGVPVTAFQTEFEAGLRDPSIHHTGPRPPR